MTNILLNVAYFEYIEYFVLRCIDARKPIETLSKPILLTYCTNRK